MSRHIVGAKKNMITRFATTLLCTVAPVALFAQQVDLRSADEFISVEGEIVGYNGVMLRVETSVGAVSVPASEVICYGAGCEVIIATNDFGLTADSFENVVLQSVSDRQTQEEQAVSSVDTLSVGFDTPALGALYRTLAGGFAVASQTTTNVDLTAGGEMN